jgi:acyl-CoA synthetase (NDP forming)
VALARRPLDRLLDPGSVALVGLSDQSGRPARFTSLFDGGREVFVVNPRYPRVMGRPTAASLTELGRPVDCVVSMVSADRTAELAEEAAGLDVGGLVLLAAGFAEHGPDGARLQARVRAAAEAGGFAALGPNCLGFENVPGGLRLSFANEEDHHAGGISVVAQSGTMVTALTLAGNAQGAGFNLLISSGNEAVTDTADLLDHLAEDPATTTIGLVLEKIHRPDAFRAAARKAIEAGKPIVALKLGRDPRAGKLVASHTGSITSDGWLYDIAFRQLGISVARDPEEAADRLSLASRIPPERWTPVERLAIVNYSGGFATLGLDVAMEEGLEVPELEELLPWVRERIPSAQAANPLDPTGLGVRYWPEILERYLASPEVDALFTTHPITKPDERTGEVFIRPVAEAAAAVAKPVVLANSAGFPPAWAAAYGGEALAFGNGVRGSLRGLETIGSFVRHRERLRPPVPAPAPRSCPNDAVVTTAGIRMLGFAATMTLLRDAGLPVARWQAIDPADDLPDLRVPFEPPWAVKLADVPHRTELGAVRLGVTATELPAVVAELRDLARRSTLPPTVVVQPMVEGSGELFVGIQGQSELGPAVMLGLGGVFVEVLGRVRGRLAPFDLDEARALIDELRGTGVLHGHRGSTPWDLDALARILVAAGDLAASGAGWIESLDVNPLVGGPGGFLAVDALLVVR